MNEFDQLGEAEPALAGEAVGVARRFVEYHIDTQLESLTVLNG